MITCRTVHTVTPTVLDELRITLERHADPLPPALPVQCALLPDLPDRERLIRAGRINLHNTDPAGDAFECLRMPEGLFLLGSTPRGLLQAVYALDEQLAAGDGLPPDWHAAGRFHPGERHFHPHFQRWPGERADIRFLSRLGASHCLVSHDWQGSRRSLQGYVTSPLFPQAVPPAEVAANHAGLAAMIGDCEDYGLGVSLWLTELPCQGGPWVPEPQRQAWLECYAPEVLSDSGTYQGKVLCFAHPRVQAYYRDLLARFFREFPSVETIFLFGMDSGGEGCDPRSCPRCRSVSKFAQRDRMIRFLVEVGGSVRPGLRVLTTGWHWESHPDEFIERQAGLPSASGVYLAAQSDGWQCERQNHAFLRVVRRVCRDRGQLFLGYDNLHLGDDATHLWGLDLQDFPLGIAAKLARWHDLGADGVFDHWGTFNETTPTNAAACREFFINPLADPETVCRQLALNQYGPMAGPHAFEAWKALEQAHRILSNATSWAPRQWPGWYKGRAAAPFPEAFAGVFAGTGNHDEHPLAVKPALGFAYNDGGLAGCLEGVATAWAGAAPCMQAAVAHLGKAITAADDLPVGYARWWNGAEAPLGRREHLIRHRRYMDLMLRLGREIGIHFGLHARYERAGRDAAAYLDGVHPLFASAMQACRGIVDFLDHLALEDPLFSTRPHAGWRDQYAGKADAIADWLGRHPPADGTERRAPVIRQC